MPKDEYNLAVIQSRLLPARPGLKFKTDMANDAFIILELRNYSSNPIIFTSAKVEVIRSHDISTTGAYGREACLLSNDPNSNRGPVTIEPGQTKWIGGALAIRFKGLLEWFPRKELESLFLHETAPHMPFTIAENYYVDILNKKLSDLYGENSAIKVTYTVNLNAGTKNFIIPLKKGKDIFFRDGSFQHDWMAAQLIEPSAIPSINLSSSECNMDKIVCFPDYE
ncbi:hypothetical protein D7U34_24975, partial [Salmonella enterica]|nr:hypothetical protein [Salmonella enterica]ECL4039434.1 hypothetical protein [Salmonella enterica]EDW1846631.1 hypothetical protein [Salmonella enterica subsp. enterica]